MIKKMWERNYRKWVGIAIILFLLGTIILALLGYEEKLKEERKFIPLSEVNPMLAEGQYVEFDYEYMVENISEPGEYQYDGQTHYSKGFEDRYNIILLDSPQKHMDRTQKDRYFVLLKIEKDQLKENAVIEQNSSKINELLDKYDEGVHMVEEQITCHLKNKIHVKGQLKKQDMFMKMRYESYFLDEGYHFREIKIYCLPYYIEPVKEDYIPPVIARFLYVLGFGLLFAATIIIAITIIRPKQARLLAHLKKIDENEWIRAENDYKHAKEYNRDILFGEKYVFFLKDSDVIKYADILWMFPYVKGQLNPFDKNKEKRVKKDCIFICDDKGNPHQISVKSIDIGKILIESLQRHCPGIQTGYSDETKRLYLFHIPDLIQKRNEVLEERERLKAGKNLNGGKEMFDFGKYMRDRQENEENNPYSPLVKKEEP